MKNQSVRIVSIAVACVAGWTLSADVVRNTYYAWGGGTTIASGRYNWCVADNWRVRDGESYVAASTYPQQGDIVIFNRTINYMSYNDGSSMPALWKVDFQTPNIIHQGYVNLLAGGEGLTMANTGDMYWWAGIELTGTGEVPINVPTGRRFTNQKGVRGTATLVKTGGGTFRTAGEGANIYRPTVTKLQGGNFQVKSSEALADGEFIFDSNDANLRLTLENYYTNVTKNAEFWYNQWVLYNGAFSESASVNNTTHGISCTDTRARAYLRLTGTPKVAEQRFTGQLYNTAGISFAPNAKQAGGADYVFTIAKSASTAGGGLAVTNGTMRLTEGATFSGLQILNVGAGATFEVVAGSGSRFYCLALDVASGGKLKIGAGVTLAFGKNASYAGTALAEGTYTADGANDTIAADWIEGDGKVVVSSYSGTYGDNQLVLDVGSATMTLAEALAAYNEANETEYAVSDLNGGALKDYTLVKRGAGTLVADTAISSFQGIVHVEAGTVKVDVQYGLGIGTKDDRPFYVHDGAMIYIYNDTGSANVSRLGSRIVHIAGTGVNDAGALKADGIHLAYGTVNMFGKSIVLDADAKVVHCDWYALSDNIYLQGNTLTVKGTRSDACPVLLGALQDNGHIKLIDSTTRRAPQTFNSTGASNVMEFGNNGGYRFWSSTIAGAGAGIWTFVFNGATTYLFGDTGTTRDSGANSFANPWFITNTVTLSSQANTAYSSIYLRNSVSGTGKFKLPADNEVSYLHLLPPAKDFSGGVDVYRGVLCTYADGTLPDSGTVTVLSCGIVKTGYMSFKPEFYGVSLFSPAFCSLPPLVFNGTVDAARIQGGPGSWKSITKEGSNTLPYNTEAGSPLLNVKGGTFKLPRGAAPGLWEGIVTCANATDANAAVAGTVLATNYVMRGPTSAVQIPYQAPSTPSATKLITYSGYVWNRTGADQTVTLATSLKGVNVVKIDGETKISAAANELKTAQVTLTPGPHAFEFRAANGNPTDASATWPANFGFVFAPGAVDTSNINVFTRGIDPGDGSFFTRSADPSELLPVFNVMQFATNTVLDVNGNAYTAAVVKGFPNVVSTATDASAAPTFTIADRFEVDGAKTVGTLSSAVPLTFGPDCVVCATNLASLKHGTYTIAQTTGDATISGGDFPKSRIAKDSKEWQIHLSGDGKSLTLEYCAGTLVIVR